MPILLILFMLIWAEKGPDAAVDWASATAKLAAVIGAIIVFIVLLVVLL